MIVSDGAFSQSGERFVSADPELWKHLEKAFRHKVLHELRKRWHISPEVQESMLFWTHSGFSVFVGAPISPDDPERLERLGRYLRRPHLAESRVRYDEAQDQVIYSSGKKPHPGFKANFRVFEAQDFIAALCGLLPDPRRHESIAYGEYSNVVRGKRAKAGTAPPLEEQDPLRIRLKKAWQEFLKRIYETDPLSCPCGGTLKRIALITDPKVIKKILLHLASLLISPGTLRSPSPTLAVLLGARNARIAGAPRALPGSTLTSRPVPALLTRGAEPLAAALSTAQAAPASSGTA